MTSGWIICLAVVSQTSAWGTPSNGWQAAPANAAQQQQFAAGVQPSQAPASQFSTGQFASGQQTGSQFAQQQPGQQMVDQYGRPINQAQNVASQQQPSQQFGQQAAQHPWQNNGSQFASNQTTPTAQQQPGQQSVDQYGRPINPAQQNQGQNWPQQNYDPRIAANNQNVSLAPQGIAAQNNYQQQQPNSAWQQANTQQGTALQLAPPQQNTAAQHQWQTQPQTNYDPRTQMSVLGQQYNNATGSSNWGTGQQQVGQQNTQPNIGSQFAQQNTQAGSQFSNSPRNPQLDPGVNGGGSQFGAQINVGDNRFRLADNTHSVLQGANQQANQGGQSNGQQPVYGPQPPPSLVLQPPLQGTLPAGSNQAGDFSQQNVNPHALVQPPRVGENGSQGTLAVEDNRWTNLQQPTGAGELGSRPTAGDLQPIPAGQANGNQLQPPAINAPPNGGANPTYANQPGNTPGGNLFGSLANRNTNLQPTAFGQNSQATGLPKDGLFAAAARNAQATQGSLLNKPEGSTGEYTPSPFAFGVSLVFNFLMVGGVLYLGWIAFESHFRYRRALLEGDDYDDSRGSRDEERSSRRR